MAGMASGDGTGGEDVGEGRDGRGLGWCRYLGEWVGSLFCVVVEGGEFVWLRWSLCGSTSSSHVLSWLFFLFVFFFGSSSLCFLGWVGAGLWLWLWFGGACLSLLWRFGRREGKMGGRGSEGVKGERGTR